MSDPLYNITKNNNPSKSLVILVVVGYGSVRVGQSECGSGGVEEWASGGVEEWASGGLRLFELRRQRYNVKA
jgi:hypothetical protein